MVNPPIRFSRTPMQEMSDSLYPQQTEPDEKEQEKAKSNAGDDLEADNSDEDGNLGVNGLAAQSGADRLHGVLGMFGVHSSGENGSRGTERTARLEAGMRMAIADAEASKGAPLTPEEERNISGEYVADHAMKWLRVRKHAPNLMVKDMWAGVDNPKYRGKCATRFREAFEAAGGDSTGHPVSAKDWGPTLEKNGYEGVSPENYVPQNGDVMVISGVTPKDPKNPTTGETNGHIEVYDAEHGQWVSERKEKGDGISQTYKDRHATISVYRFNPF